MIKKLQKKKFEETAQYSVFAVIAVFVLWLVLKYKNDATSVLINGPRREEFFSSVATTLQDFLTLTLGILVEAFPFLILGIAISVIIQLFVHKDTLLKRLPKNTIIRRLIVSFLGVLMPVCECGNVPVARSLMVKGLSVQESVIFLLAAPSINIITFLVTREVFGNTVATIRIVGTLIIANIAAVVLTRLLTKKQILTDDFAAACEMEHQETKSVESASRIFSSEMWLMGRMLVIGAMIAAATQVFIPRETLEAIGSNMVLSVLAMLALAFVISICSSVDAFFALAFTNSFNTGSIVAFLVAGPMVDIKMLALLKTTFTVKALIVITATVFSLSFLLGIGLQYVL